MRSEGGNSDGFFARSGVTASAQGFGLPASTQQGS
jgi:hypothetical protein